MASQQIRYPFSAVVGQDELRLALILTAISPRIGGVVIRGEKGTAKTTTVRAFAGLLGDAPLVNLPLGSTEDRVVGSLNMETVLTTGRAEYQPGLLAQADGGVLYVDEVNLLADHLVDALLDAAASGRVSIERDGISHSSPANFVLVGTMNPEEGELRPQLLDRFGLAVDVAASTNLRCAWRSFAAGLILKTLLSSSWLSGLSKMRTPPTVFWRLRICCLVWSCRI